MNVKPLADRILVRRIEEKETVKGGIIIPDTAKEKPQEGEVVAVGPGRFTEDGKRIAMEVKKGDRVLIGKYSGTDVKIDGTEYVILREDIDLGCNPYRLVRFRVVQRRRLHNRRKRHSPTTLCCSCASCLRAVRLSCTVIPLSCPL